MLPFDPPETFKLFRIANQMAVFYMTRNTGLKWVGMTSLLSNLNEFSRTISTESSGGFLTVAPWCSGYHYYTTSFNLAWTQILCRFKFCSLRVRDSRWWGSLTMVLVGNKAKRLLSVNHTTKTIHHHLPRHRQFLVWRCSIEIIT